MLAKIIIFVFVALISFGSTSTTLSVGKPRTAVTPGLAAGVATIALLEFAALAYLYTQL